MLAVGADFARAREADAKRKAPDPSRFTDIDNALGNALSHVAAAKCDTRALPPECNGEPVVARTFKSRKIGNGVARLFGCVLLAQIRMEPLDIDGRYKKRLAACNDPEALLTP
jgi:hypothetical protein